MRTVGRCLGLLLFASPILAKPCITVGQHGAAISITEETAAIVWDADRHLETFVREAGFVTHARDFGFLVPSPTAPKLWEAGPNVFRGISQVVAAHRPPIVVPATKGGPVATAGAVNVIRRQRVGKYDAAILSSRDAGAVAAWLKKNGYTVEPKTREWLAPYLSKGWAITAFKVAANAGMGVLPAVAMSFKADKPFYPYREPSGSPNLGGRTLRVFVVSNGPVEAKLGGRGWPVTREYSSALTPSEASKVKADLKASRIALPKSAWLTSYVDLSNPRKGTDDIQFLPERHTMASPATYGGVVVGLGLLATLLLQRVATHRKRQGLYSPAPLSQGTLPS